MERKIANVVVAMFVGLVFQTTAYAQTHVRPDGFGGYNIYGPNGQIQTTRPDGLGGYNTYGPDGQIQTTRPDGLGGYTIYDY